MIVDVVHFTPARAALGGGLIGLAVSLLWLGIGRIGGISGIVGGVLAPVRGDLAWRMAFIGGLVLAPMVFALAAHLTVAPAVSGPAQMAGAGLLVGFGTRLGGGCTSGHGVCGLARLSRRSVLATTVFMAAAMTTVFVTHHLIGAA